MTIPPESAADDAVTIGGPARTGGSPTPGFTSDTDLARLDDALVRLRRLWSSPRQVLDHDGRPVEMSSILVVEACARGAARVVEVSVGDVAVFADVTPSTASRLVDRAVRAELVRRNPSGDDARRSVLVLTTAGQALQARALRARLGWLSSVVDSWAHEDLTALASLLGRFAESMALTGPPGDGHTGGDERG